MPTYPNDHAQFELLDQWTQFLITESLVPESQLSTDDFAGSLANQTNLAIKGIIGIRAMGEMADVLKANVLTFAGMGEEAVMGLPPEARTMVMTGTNAMMNAQAQGGGGPPAPGGGGETRGARSASSAAWDVGSANAGRSVLG